MPPETQELSENDQIQLALDPIQKDIERLHPDIIGTGRGLEAGDGTDQIVVKAFVRNLTDAIEKGIHTLLPSTVEVTLQNEKKVRYPVQMHEIGDIAPQKKEPAAV